MKKEEKQEKYQNLLTIRRLILINKFFFIFTIIAMCLTIISFVANYKMLDNYQKERVSGSEVVGFMDYRLEGYEPECAESKQVERYVLREIIDKKSICQTYDSCMLFFNYSSKCITQNDCVSNINNLNLSIKRPYLEFYNETVCTKYILTRKNE